MFHAFHPTVLREYDIRGIVGETLSDVDAYHIGKAFAHIAREKFGHAPTIAIGYDGRLTSPGLAAALTKGLTEAGAQVKNIGRGPTPMLYFAVHELKADGGIMITGSHNPPSHNGFKMMLGHASFFGADIRKLGERVAAGLAGMAGGGEARVDIREKYIARLLKDAPNLLNSPSPYPLPSRERGKLLRVAYDPGNGAAGEVVEALVKSFAGEHIVINAKIDGTFPAHHPDPSVAKNLEQLIALVTGSPLPPGGGGPKDRVRAAFDLGIAFDGDGDRIGVVDGQGRILWGDQLLLIYAGEVLKNHPGATVIGDVKASRVLFDGVKKLGGTPLMWKTGHSHIKAKMKETGAKLAGEMSGHMFFADHYYGFDDAIYAAVRLVNLLADPASPSLGQLLDAQPKLFNTPELRIDCKDERKFAVIDEVKAHLKQSGAAFDDVDGVRVKTPDGWWLLRASNTGGHLIVRAEATTKDALATLYGNIAAELKSSGVELPAL